VPRLDTADIVPSNSPPPVWKPA